ncbi:TPA: hypothetical protein ACOJM5_004156 [Pseudomonas putida]
MVPDKFESLLEIVRSKLRMLWADGDIGSPCHHGDKIKWSKGPGFSVIPYGLELGGVKPSPIVDVEPKNKKNCFKYYFDSDDISRSEIYGVSSTVIETEIYQVEGDGTFSVRFDEDGEAIRASGVIYVNGLPYLSCRLEDDGEYWCYEYKCAERQVASIVVYAINSVPGTEIHVQRVDNILTGLYFYNGAEKIYVYQV